MAVCVVKFKGKQRDIFYEKQIPSIPTLSSSSLESATGPRFSCFVIQGDSAIKLWFLIFIIVQANLRLILLPQPDECWDCRLTPSVQPATGL